MAKFKVGDRVRYTRSYPEYGIKPGALGTVDENSNIPFVIWDSADCERRWAIMEERLELVTSNQGDNKVSERRTFKQLKDTPDVKKGALWQEQCEDGTQPYESRKLVEEQPDWFVEVFKVHPEYMTKEELEKWEAFKSGRVAKVAPKKAKKASKTKATPRVEVYVDLVTKGLTRKQIAKKMKIQKSSVDTYHWKAQKAGLL